MSVQCAKEPAAQPSVTWATSAASVRPWVGLELYSTNKYNNSNMCNCSNTTYDYAISCSKKLKSHVGQTKTSIFQATHVLYSIGCSTRFRRRAAFLHHEEEWQP